MDQGLKLLMEKLKTLYDNQKQLRVIKKLVNTLYEHKCVFHKQIGNGLGHEIASERAKTFFRQQKILRVIKALTNKNAST